MITRGYLTLNEAREWLAHRGHPRSFVWLKKMVYKNKIETTLAHGRRWVTTKELRRVLKEKPVLKVVISMLALFVLFAQPVQASTPVYFNAVVDAIYLAEGAEKASKPFGILSVHCEGFDHCRRICYNTVRNNWRRWTDAGRPGEYIDFLANRYAPPQAHHLNKHWPKNVRFFLRKGGFSA